MLRVCSHAQHLADHVIVIFGNMASSLRLQSHAVSPLPHCFHPNSCCSAASPHLLLATHDVASGHPNHLHNVSTRFHCPQTFLSLDFQCRDDVSESK